MDLEDPQGKSGKSTIIEYPAKCPKSTHSMGLLPTNFLCNSGEDIYRFKNDMCVNVEKQNVSSYEYNWDPTNNGDSISEDDIVRNQYSLLPFPPVREDHFHKEKGHYSGSERNKPFVINPPIVLENLNHFLFKGGNNFM